MSSYEFWVAPPAASFSSSAWPTMSSPIEHVSKCKWHKRDQTWTWTPTMNHHESQEVFKPSTKNLRDIRILPFLLNQASHISPRTNGCLLRLLLRCLRLLRHYPKFETTARYYETSQHSETTPPPKKKKTMEYNDRSWRFDVHISFHLPSLGDYGFHMVSHVCVLPHSSKQWQSMAHVLNQLHFPAKFGQHRRNWINGKSRSGRDSAAAYAKRFSSSSTSRPLRWDSWSKSFGDATLHRIVAELTALYFNASMIEEQSRNMTNMNDLGHVSDQTLRIINNLTRMLICRPTSTTYSNVSIFTRIDLCHCGSRLDLRVLSRLSQLSLKLLRVSCFSLALLRTFRHVHHQKKRLVKWDQVSQVLQFIYSRF